MSHNNNDIIEEEDQLVASYDVYLSTALSGNVHLFQFPLRPFPRPYEASSIKLSCTSGEGIGTSASGGHNNNNRPPSQHQSSTAAPAPNVNGDSTPHNNGRYTMEINLDTYDSPCFRLAPPVAGKEVGSYTYHLSSEPFVPRSNYAVGVLKEGGLHLCPISSIQQFTPVVSAESRMIAPTTNTGNNNPAAMGGGGVDDFGQGRSGGMMGQKSSSSNNNNTSANANANAAGMLVAVESKFCSISGPTPEGPGALLTREQESLRLLRSTLLNADSATAQPLAFYHLETPESQTKSRMLTSTVLSNSSSVAQPEEGDDASTSSRQRKVTTETFYSAEKLLDTGAEVAKRIVLKRGGRYDIREQVQDLIVAAQVLTTGDIISMVEEASNNNNDSSSSAATISNEAYNKVIRALLEFAYYMHGVWVSRTPPLKGGFPQIRDLVLLKFAQSNDGILYRADISSELTRNHPAVGKAVLKYLDMVAQLIDPSRRYLHNGDLSQVWGTHERSYGLPPGIQNRANGAEEATADLGRAWRLKRSVWKSSAMTSAAGELVSPLEQRVHDLTFTPADYIKYNSKFENDFKTDIAAQVNLWADGGRYQRIVASSIRDINEGSDVGILQTGIVGGGGMSSGARGGGGGSARPQMTSMMPTSTSTGNQNITSSAGSINTPEMVMAVKEYVMSLFKEHGVINKTQAKQKIQQQSRDPHSSMFSASTESLAKACRELLTAFTASTFVLAETPSSPEVAPYRRYILTATCERPQFTAADVVERVVSLMEQNLAASATSAAPLDINRAAVKIAVNAMIGEVAVFRSGERLWSVKSGTIEM